MAAVTLSHAWQLLLSLPMAARVTVALLPVLLVAGVWSVSKGAATVLVGAAGLVLAFWQRVTARLRRTTAPLPLPAEPVSHARARTALDEAYDLATRQAEAQAETGQGWAMPTRQQIAADLGLVSAEHDRVELSTGECLTFAALAAGFDRAFRPPISAEPSDPDDAHHW